MLLPDLLVYFFLLTGTLLSAATGKLTKAGAFLGGLVGLLVYKGEGLAGLTMLVTFFAAGSFATGWKLKEKQNLGIAENKGGRRTAGQVFANGSVAAVLGGIAWCAPQNAPSVALMIAGSLASATADTLSSELGSVYGRTFYDIISFNRVSPGSDGVISLEGTVIGAAGAALIAFIYILYFGFNYFAGGIIIAGVVGNLADSVLGATLERKNLIGNNTVNFLNTCMGAAIGLLWYKLLS